MSTARGFLGAGDVMSDVWNDATQSYNDSWLDFGECEKFAIASKSEVRDQKSRARGRRGDIVASVALKEPPEIEIVIAEVNAENIRLAFMGSLHTMTQSGGTLQSGSPTVNYVPVTAKVGRWVQVGARNLSAEGLTVQENTDATPETYVEGVDYLINRRLGLLKATPGGALANDQIVRVAGAYLSVSGNVVRGSVRPQIRTRLLLDGENLVDGSDCECEVFEAVLSPAGEFDFMAENFNSITLKGKLITPPDKPSPYEVRFPKLAAA